MSPSLIHNWKRLRREAEKIASEPMQFIPYGAVSSTASARDIPSTGSTNC